MSRSSITTEPIPPIPPIHPGEILKEEFMEPLGLSANRLAAHIGVPANRISAIVKGARGITGDTALRLSRAFGTSAEFWMNLQSHFELERAGESTLPNIPPIETKSAAG